MTEIGCDKVAVVDTPGAFDSGGALADYEHAQDLVKYLKGCGGVKAFIVICKHRRLDGTFLNIMKNLSIMMGREFWDYFIFVVTPLRINCKKRKEENKNDEDDDDNLDEKKDETELEEEDDIGDDEVRQKPPQEWLREFCIDCKRKI